MTIQEQEFDDFQTSDPPAPYMLEAISNFFRQYLVCSDDQLTILVLWTIHTWISGGLPTTAYLDIRSPEPQCGKTQCLHLLAAFCCDPLVATGPAAPTLMEQLITIERKLEVNPKSPGLAGVLLLDDCHHTFSFCERQPLVALLNSGINANYSYLCRLRSQSAASSFFYPKAFAGNHRLPRSLADRCIPILLQRKKPSESVKRLCVQRVSLQIRSLVDWIMRWGLQNYSSLILAARNPPEGLPANLTPRQQDCAEPLLHVANAVGGDWPEKARSALRAIFKTADTSYAVQLLSDIRDAFAAKSNPRTMSTQALLSFLTVLDYRPWSAWSLSSGRQLAGLLRPFGIFSRTSRTNSKTVLRCYHLKDFLDAWERYLPPAS